MIAKYTHEIRGVYFLCRGVAVSNLLFMLRFMVNMEVAYTNQENEERKITSIRYMNDEKIRDSLG